jgi:hypothetical protein
VGNECCHPQFTEEKGAEDDGPEALQSVSAFGAEKISRVEKFGRLVVAEGEHAFSGAPTRPGSRPTFATASTFDHSFSGHPPPSDHAALPSANAGYRWSEFLIKTGKIVEDLGERQATATVAGFVCRRLVAAGRRSTW